MLIECTIKRLGGSLVEFDKWPSEACPNAVAPAARYHFKPASTDPEAPHTCEVPEPAHIQRLLSITGQGGSSAYRLVHPADPLTIPAQATSAAANVVAPDPGAAVPVKDAAVVEPNQKADDIRALPIRDLKSRINTFAEVDLRAALASEIASADGPRKGFIEVVKAHLGDQSDE